MHLTAAELNKMTDAEIRAHVAHFGPGIVGDVAFKRATAVNLASGDGKLGRGALLPHELAALDAANIDAGEGEDEQTVDAGEGDEDPASAQDETPAERRRKSRRGADS